MFQRLKSYVIFTLFLTSILAVTSCENPQEIGDAIDALPMRSAVIMRVNDLDELRSEMSRNAIYGELDTLDLFKDFEGWANALPSHYNSFWVAAHASGAESYDLLFAANATETDSLPANLEWASREYAGTTIYSASKNDKEWYVASYKNVNLLSQSNRLIEEAIRQLDSDHSIREDEDFNTVLRTTNSKDPLNVLINYQEVSGMLAFAFPNAPLSYFESLGTWAAYDLAPEVDEWMFSGVHLNSDSSNSWLSCFADNRAGKFEAQSLLPYNTAQAVMINMGSFSQYNRNYQEYLRRDDRLRIFQQQIDRLDFDISSVLHSWGSESFGLISLETSPDAIAQPRIAYIKARDTEKAIEALSAQADSNFIENHRNYIIHKSAYKNLLLLGYGRIFKDMISPYYTVHDEYVIFGNNLLTLKGMINDLIDGRTLPAQAGFNDAVGELPSNAHVRILHKNPGALGLVRRLIDQDETDQIDDHMDPLSKIAWTVAQYKVDDDVSYSHLFIKHQEEYTPEAKQLWAVPLQGEVIGRPQLVKNHYTQKNEVIVQDENFNFYLIDHGGKVLWKRQLDGPILGEVEQVDLFRNNKLQLAFNTEQFIYIIDRNGDDVAPFPAALPEKASGPMAVFDYDNVKNYRFIVPCGNRVLNYSKEGTQVDGWVFNKTESPVLREPQHFTVGTRDFIVIREKNGLVHLVSRRGETRIPMQDRLPDTHNDLFLSVGSSAEETRLITLSEGGKLVSLFMNGTVDSTDIDLADDPGNFVYADGKYIISQNGRIIVKDELHPFEIDIDASLSKPLYFIRNGSPIYGVVAADKDQAWLYGQSGDPLPGLPLYGASPFEVGEFGIPGVLNLIIGTEDGNLLNYKLE